MDQKDKDIKRAIDDIFGDDVIEINVDNNTLENSDKKSDVSSTSLNDDASIDTDVLAEEKAVTNDNKQKDNEAYSLPEINSPKDNEVSDSQEVNEQSKNVFHNKRIIIYFVIGFIIGLILIYTIVNYLNGKERVINCSYQAEDTGYRVTDEYKITYVNDDVTYVEGVYNYTAKTDEYKQEVAYVKEEKLPVIINSNGMKGFTYTYETNDTFFKVSSYLDFTLFDYDEIGKINQEVTPISYFDINSKMNVNDLRTLFEDQGYVCNVSD